MCWCTCLQFETIYYVVGLSLISLSYFSTSAIRWSIWWSLCSISIRLSTLPLNSGSVSKDVSTVKKKMVWFFYISLRFIFFSDSNASNASSQYFLAYLVAYDNCWIVTGSSFFVINWIISTLIFSSSLLFSSSESVTGCDTVLFAGVDSSLLFN